MLYPIKFETQSENGFASGVIDFELQLGFENANVWQVEINFAKEAKLNQFNCVGDPQWCQKV